jgi:hypothetical protein
MRIEISTNRLLMLQQSKNKYLFSTWNHRMFVVEDFTVEEIDEIEIKKYIFGKPENIPVKKCYLTDIKIMSYHSTGKFCGYLSDDSVKAFLEKDLFLLRQNWIDLKDMLKAFGLEVNKIEKPVTEPEYSI